MPGRAQIRPRSRGAWMAHVGSASSTYMYHAPAHLHPSPHVHASVGSQVEHLGAGTCRKREITSTRQSPTTATSDLKCSRSPILVLCGRLGGTRRFFSRCWRITVCTTMMVTADIPDAEAVRICLAHECQRTEYRVYRADEQVEATSIVCVQRTSH